MEPQVLTRWQDPTIEKLKKENKELKEKCKQLEEIFNHFHYRDFYQILNKHPEYEDFIFKIDELKEEIQDYKIQLKLKESEIQNWKNYCSSIKTRNKELKEEICAWALVVRWAIEWGLTLDQVVADEDMDDFFQEMDEKDMDYLYGFLEYAKKCIKEGKA